MLVLNLSPTFLADVLRDFINERNEVGVAAELVFNFVARMHHSGVILATERVSDFNCREVSQCAAQIHRHLPRKRDRVCSTLGLHVPNIQIKMTGHNALCEFH